jgi:hypothetical protein
MWMGCVDRQQRGPGGRCGCRWRNVKRSPGAWQLVSRCGPSLDTWGGRRRRSRVRSGRTVAAVATGRWSPMRGRGGGLYVPSSPSLPVRSWGDGWWKPLWSGAGHPSRSPGGYDTRSPTGRSCGCLPRRSTSPLYVQARGGLRKELTAHLRRPRTKRRPRGHSTFNGQGQLRGVVNISQRPPEANDRAVPGHWESQWGCQAA